jgi:hypothetical protein
VSISVIEVSINSLSEWTSVIKREGTDSRSVIKKKEGKELTISIDMR